MFVYTMQPVHFDNRLYRANGVLVLSPDHSWTCWDLGIGADAVWVWYGPDCQSHRNLVVEVFCGSNPHEMFDKIYIRSGSVKGVLHCAGNRGWNHDWIFQNEQRSFWKFLTEIGKKINNRTNTAISVWRVPLCRKSAEPKPIFFRKWSELMSRVCCAWRNNQYVLAAETVITNAACAAAAFSSSSSTSIILSAKQNIWSVT